MAVELESLGRSVKQLQYRHHRAMERGLAPLGTTFVQWDALRAIANNPGASAHALALETFQSDQSFGTLATRLEVRGLIERAPGGGRKIEHRLSAQGERMLAAGRPVLAGVAKTSFAPLSEQERATLLELLSRVLAEPAPGDEG